MSDLSWFVSFYHNLHIRLLWCAKCAHRLVLSAHRWFSGRMLACHAGGPGSIPGRCKFSLLLCSIWGIIEFLAYMPELLPPWHISQHSWHISQDCPPWHISQSSWHLCQEMLLCAVRLQFPVNASFHFFYVVFEVKASHMAAWHLLWHIPNFLVAIPLCHGVHFKTRVRQPGVEPGSTAWKATMLTVTPLTLHTFSSVHLHSWSGWASLQKGNLIQSELFNCIFQLYMYNIIYVCLMS